MGIFVVLCLAVFVPLISAAPGTDTCSQCMTLLDSMGPESADEGLSAREMCAMLGQCEMTPVATVDNGVIQETLRGGTLWCHVCRLVTATLHRFLSDPHWQKVILRLMKLACSYVPFVGQTCSDLVNQYGVLIINLLGRFVQPEICHSVFHICPNMTDALAAREDCRLCELGLGVIYDTVHDPALHDRLELIFRAFCETERPSMRQECMTSFRPLVVYAMKLADDLKRVPDIMAFCQKNNMCPAGLYMP